MSQKPKLEIVSESNPEDKSSPFPVLKARRQKRSSTRRSRNFAPCGAIFLELRARAQLVS